MFAAFVFLSLSILPAAEDLSIEKVDVVQIQHVYNDKTAQYMFTQYIFWDKIDSDLAPYKVRSYYIVHEKEELGNYIIDNDRQIFI